MEADLQVALADYVLAGGNLLLVGTGLIDDERGFPCHLLYERLKIKARRVPGVRTVQCLGLEIYLANTDISVFDNECAAEDAYEVTLIHLRQPAGIPETG